MHHAVIDFWFHEVTPAQWWKADPSFDELIRSRFGALHAQAIRSELFAWRDEPAGRLAEVIVLDQFSRNLHRDDARAFAADPMALALAQEAVRVKADRALPPVQRSFLYLPYMHSESRAIHAVAEQLFEANGVQENHAFELRHKAVIDRFGRYPHRNAVLGRTSTAEELAFLAENKTGF